jgi:hypothetical protein
MRHYRGGSLRTVFIPQHTACVTKVLLLALLLASSSRGPSSMIVFSAASVERRRVSKKKSKRPQQQHGRASPGHPALVVILTANVFAQTAMSCWGYTADGVQPPGECSCLETDHMIAV